MADEPPFWERMAQNASMMIAGTPQAQALGMRVVSIDEARAVRGQMKVEMRDVVG